MKLKKRKLKFTALFFLSWFLFLVLITDGLIGFQTLVDTFGSFLVVEIALWILVLVPTVAVYHRIKEK